MSDKIPTPAALARGHGEAVRARARADRQGRYESRLRSSRWPSPCSSARSFILASGHSPVAAFAALLQGAFGSQRADRRDAAAVDAAHLHGSRGRVRLPRRALQHRRRGPAVPGRAGRRVSSGSCVGGLPWIVSVPLILLVRGAGGRRVGVHPGAHEGEDRRHEVITTMMFTYIGRYLVSWVVTGPLKDEGGIPQTPQLPPELDAAAAAPRRSRSSSRTGRTRASSSRVVVALVVWAALKYTTLGYEARAVGFNPFASADRRHLGLLDHRQVAVHLGRARGSRGRRRGDGRPRPAVRPVLVRLRVHRHRRRAARQEQPDRRHPGGAPVRRAVGRRGDDAARGGRLPEGHRDHPGHHHLLRRRRDDRDVGARTLAQAEGGEPRCCLSILTPDLFASAIRLATPIALAAIGATICERSGVVNIAWKASCSSAPSAASLGALLTGIALGRRARRALRVVPLRVAARLRLGQPAVRPGRLGHRDQHPRARRHGLPDGDDLRSPRQRRRQRQRHGRAGSRASGRTVSTIQPVFDFPAGGPGSSARSGRGSTRSSSATRPIVYAGIFFAIFLTWAMYRTRWGLRLRALGEHPRAADTVGINVVRGRWVAVLISGLMAGLAGANLSLEQVGRLHREHDQRARLHRAGGQHLRPLDSRRERTWRRCCSASPTRSSSSCSSSAT